jgi:hypothetical protein
VSCTANDGAKSRLHAVFHVTLFPVRNFDGKQ